MIAFSGLFAGSAIATEPDQNTTSLEKETASLHFGLEKIKLPGNERMGMINTSYLIQIAPELYFGPSVYGSVSGKRGGFYTIGGELTWRHPLVSKLTFDTGMYVGGGGGGTSLVGGGLMLRPHADLMWDFGGYRAGISASQVRFPNGHINSNQIGLMVDFDTDFLHTSASAGDHNWPSTIRTGVGFDRAMAVFGRYQPRSNSQFISGAPLQQSIGYVGTRMERFLTPGVFVGLEANGAGSGGVAGYAEYLATAGAEMPIFSDNFKVGTRFDLGMGGGGAVSVGGGIMLKAGVYASANLSKNFHINVEGGMVDSPNGNFRATYGSVALQWDLDHPFSQSSSSTVIANEWIGGTQHYFSAARKDGSKRDMDNVTLQLNRYLTDTIYLTGQAHSAYSGNAGGYSVGLVGLGYHSPKTSSGLYTGTEILAGAAGGGGVDTNSGFLIQPSVYLGIQINKNLSAQLNAGRVKSLKGNLNSTLLGLGLCYSFGTVERH
ncbi:hypothetical protein [Undibacterium oligocarboniphilum]|uniref:Uncharacterized protein n=1 Tax=Undibacterium oligocarboniphilum TaxID=666702 RepID=A0A850QGL1_9BURK|nr:hypothetical protein [Undibacterium oligocarboniphilum]MBC3870136.1 hypothetical protein [Undibacterium oligocarboniphilum]NVO78127.1 hypothetical protein [Undibacterium oligocarboniphilum]